MTDKQKVLVTLALLSETCLASTPPLSQPPIPPLDPSSTPNHPVTVLRKDFLSLLSLIYTSATKLTLALRPPSSSGSGYGEPAYKAALPVVSDLVKHISSLTTCATLFDEHGSSLATEVRGSASEVCEATQSLATTFVSSSTSPAAQRTSEQTQSDTNGGEGDHLYRTGAVHQTIERIRAELPENNLAAVKRRWDVDRGMLQDSLEDVDGMIEDAVEGEGGEVEGDGFGSEDEDELLGALGLGKGKKLSKAELERVKKIQPLLRICVLLHKRVPIDLLKAPSIANTVLDSLPPLSHQLLLAIEEVVATLYAPQDLKAMSEALTMLNNAVRSLRETLTTQDLIPPSPSGVENLEVKMAATSLGGGTTSGVASSVKKEKDVRKWFETCFEQINKLFQANQEALDSGEQTT